MATKGRRGFKFTTQEIESLLDIIEEIIPIGNPDWEKVWDKHMVCYPKKERTPKLLRRKFRDLAKSKVPTGDPNCPPHIHAAKCIYPLIVKVTDGSDGESGGGDDDFPPTLMTARTTTNTRVTRTMKMTKTLARMVESMVFPSTSPLVIPLILHMGSPVRRHARRASPMRPQPP